MIVAGTRAHSWVSDVVRNVVEEFGIGKIDDNAAVADEVDKAEHVENEHEH